MSKKQSQAVILEGTRFDSICAAAAYLKTDPSCIQWALKNSKDRKYKGLTVKYEDASLEQAAIDNLEKRKAERTLKRKVKLHKKADGKRCPIFCETLNRTFKDIKSAAKFAKVSGYTLSTKTETSGMFVDKAGNVYKRLKPMKQRTNKVYPDTGIEIKVERPQGYTRTVTPKETIPESKPVVIDANPVTVLQNNAISHIKNGDYVSAEKFLTALKVISNK